MTLPVEVSPNLMYKAASGGYQIPRSLRFRSSASAYLSRSYSSISGTEFTFSVWVKRGTLNTTQSIYSDALARFINFNTANQLEISSGYTTQTVFRDPSAWYHIVVRLSNGDLSVYINGQQDQTTGVEFSLFQHGSATTHRIGAGTTTNFFDGYLTEVNFIVGQALTASSFGETDPITGVWRPKKYSGSYGVGGYYLNFSDNSAATAAAIGKDYSGNGNDWTPNNISVTAGATYDSMIDTPTLYDDGDNGRGNYATGNPLFVDTGAYTTWSGGNLNFSVPNNGKANSSIAVSSGKWYAEVVYTSNPLGCGVAQAGITSRYVRAIHYGSTGQKVVDGTVSSYGTSFTNGDVIGIALDMDSGNVTFYKNNVSQGNIALSGASIDLAVFSLYGGGSVTSIGSYNFGQRPFVYSPPAGYKALNTQNLPTPTIVKPSTAFNTVLYTGTGAARTISGLEFSPDLVWIKGRSTVDDHALFDTSRGATNYLKSNTTGTELTLGSTLSAFNSDGFSLGSAAITNTLDATYAAWAWDKGTTPGFDIVTYAGNSASRNISHGLGVAPQIYMIKRRSGGTGEWMFFTTLIDGTVDLLKLNAVNSKVDTGYTAPTSSVFSVDGSADLNINGSNYVAYLFDEVAGFSRFGRYTGNGSADGPFVSCGFRPAFVLVKMTSSTGNWTIFDSKRIGRNARNDRLFPNLTNIENTTATCDITSNGFKIRTTDATLNTNAGTYIFAAFAEHPFKYALAR